MKLQSSLRGNRNAQNYLTALAFLGFSMLSAMSFTACENKSPLVQEQPQDPNPYMFFASNGQLSESATAALEEPLEAATPKPDLVPNPITGDFAFCGKYDDGDLLVIVKNRGNAPSVVCKTMVEFTKDNGASTKVYRRTRALGLSQTDSLKFNIPAGYYDPDLEFIITVDSDHLNKESYENNNKGKGKCIGY